MTAEMIGQNIRKKEILRGRRNFESLFRGGRAVAVRQIRVVYRANGLDRSRIAVSIGKKQGKSHERNYMRRVIREILRQNRTRLRPGYDMSIIVRDRAFAKLDFADKARTVMACLERV